MMKNELHDVPMERRRVPWWQGLAAGLLGLCLLTGGLVADPDSSLNANGPGGGVGTLPATAGDGTSGLPGPGAGAFEGSETVHPSVQGGAAGVPGLTLSGTADELNALIALVWGPGSEEHPGWYELSSEGALSTVTFHGPVVLYLDRGVLHSSRSLVGLAVDPLAVGTLVARTAQGRTGGVLVAGLNALSLHRADRLGLLDAGMTIVTRNAAGERTSSLRLSTEGHLIRIEQLQ